MYNPYELLDEVCNMPAPKPLPSRDEMCLMIARYESLMADLESLRTTYRIDRARFLYEYEKQAEIEQAYADLPPRYKVQP